MSKTLVVYFSRGGNTRRVAEMIANTVGGDLFAIEPANPYSTSYSLCLAEARGEQDLGIRPALAHRQSGKGYDTILVGTPNWWGTLAPSVASFLEQCDFPGKTIAPFCTHGGGGEGRCLYAIAKACTGAEVKQGLALYEDGGAGANIRVLSWLASINLV